MILFAFSMPPLTPIAMMISAAASPMICHMLLPTVKIPPSSIMRTAAPSDSEPGAAASKVPPIMPTSVPIAKSCPEIPIKQYLKIQPMTTV